MMLFAIPKSNRGLSRDSAAETRRLNGRVNYMRSWSLFAAACAVVFTMACGQTDAGITSNVKGKLAADDAVKAYQVDVDTRDHVVTLSGTVDSVVAKERAVVLARGTNGVTDVVDNIRLSETVATSGIDDAGDAAARKVRDGADSVADATRRAGSSVQRSVNDSDVDDKVEHNAKEGSDAVVDGAKKVGKATKKGAEAVADGAKKVGSEVKDVFTDNDPDTNKDGK
jgi:hypothetical protein